MHLARLLQRTMVRLGFDASKKIANDSEKNE